MTRAADRTRQSLIDAALVVFADKGYGAGSVRDITVKAHANQGAITYHFGGKEGLYREVLKATFVAFKKAALLDEDLLDSLDRDAALRLFVKQQLLPLLKRNQLARYIRILNWEILQRTDVFQELAMSENMSLVTVVERLVRKFLPADATAEDIAVTTLWLLHQGLIFVRDSAYLTLPPHNIALDEAFVERLIDRLSRLLASGLSGTP
ncbi:TetR/AcrR family transcriptional regulator [Microvirga antarctica]|uniref:TetR/AcrR family transcriptional regulator n=1 Tax=Microvirga antarctica TaxID=2819233 RepID=UPI001B305FF4|nr:TetR/AcrR family transcriptional regulator [Microvirga antarctica]